MAMRMPVPDDPAAEGEHAKPAGWGERFTMVPNTVLASKALPPAARIVYMALLSQCYEQERICWPGKDTLVEHTGLTVRTIDAAIKTLIDAGWVALQQSGGGREHTNRYLLMGPDTTTPEQPGNVREFRNPAKSAPFVSKENGVKSAPFTQHKPRKICRETPQNLPPNNKREQEKISTPDGVAASRGQAAEEQGQAATHSDISPRAAPLCDTIGIPSTSTNLKAMTGVVTRWAEPCETVCQMSLEEKALDSRAWLDGPGRQKRRQPSVAFFRNWVQGDVERATQKATSATAAQQSPPRSEPRPTQPAPTPSPDAVEAAQRMDRNQGAGGKFLADFWAKQAKRAQQPPPGS